jgi:PHS family inorganic phosphate transporter-like MFS transporter
MTLLYAAMGFWYDAVAANMWFFVALYGLTFFFSNFGPNATTYLLPTQVFAVEHRTTYHGYAAAAGKAGAIVGSFFFKFLVDAAGVDATLYVCALTSLLGLVATVVFIREPAKEAPDVAKQLAEEETYLVPGPDGISRVSFGSISQLSST